MLRPLAQRPVQPIFSTRNVSSSPYGRTHRVVRADGSSFTHWVTSPRSMLRLTRDTTNNPIWNTYLWADAEASQEEASTTGRLGRFNRRFEGIGGGQGQSQEWMEGFGGEGWQGQEEVVLLEYLLPIIQTY
ncbi:50s ribosomal protein [Moniliophthora roreri]|nr:50s ribosomal protein [Moniliophthora roreri]